jgi:hypothetical protein
MNCTVGKVSDYASILVLDMTCNDDDGGREPTLVKVHKVWAIREGMLITANLFEPPSVRILHREARE